MQRFEQRIAEGFLYCDCQFAIDPASEDFLRRGMYLFLGCSPTQGWLTFSPVSPLGTGNPSNSIIATRWSWGRGLDEEPF